LSSLPPNVWNSRLRQPNRPLIGARRTSASWTRALTITTSLRVSSPRTRRNRPSRASSRKPYSFVTVRTSPATTPSTSASASTVRPVVTVKWLRTSRPAIPTSFFQSNSTTWSAVWSNAKIAASHTKEKLNRP
jgi:hypothetical protein